MYGGILPSNSPVTFFSDSCGDLISGIITVDVQIHMVFSKLNVTRKRVFQQRRFSETSLGHEIKEDTLTIMPHLHGYSNHDLVVQICQSP
jgi:hypothetical protein